jgi:hypothetical protein
MQILSGAMAFIPQDQNVPGVLGGGTTQNTHSVRNSCRKLI